MERQTRQSADIPKWVSATRGGSQQARTDYEGLQRIPFLFAWKSIARTCAMSDARVQPGPINTFPKWQELGRHVKRGERALFLCMPITCTRRNEETANNDETDGEGTFTSFVYKARWFVLSQTEGQELEPQVTPEWDAKRALETLGIELIAFDSVDGNTQGFARKRQIAINPVAQLPHKTLFHELAHVVTGHTAEADFADTEKTPRNLREVEAEAAALLCCEIAKIGDEGLTVALDSGREVSFEPERFRHIDPITP